MTTATIRPRTQDEAVPETLMALCAVEYEIDTSIVRMGNTPTSCVRPGPQDGAMVDDHA